MGKAESEKLRIDTSLHRINQLLATEIFTDTSLSVFGNSVVTEILIHLHDLLSFCSEKNNRIIIRDTAGQQAEDITELIRIFRNGVCHIDSDYRNIEPDRQFVIYFNESFAVGTVGHPDGFRAIVENQRPNEISLVMGKRVLSIQRHLILAFRLAEIFINSYYGKL